MNRARSALLLLSLSTTAASLAAGCGEDEVASAPVEGVDAATATTGDAEVGGDAGGPDRADGAPARSPLCSGLASFHQRCGFTSQCDQDLVAQCDAFQDAFSAALAGAVSACAATAACKDSSGDRVEITDDPCTAEKLAAATPSPAQVELARAYCAICAGEAPATCESDFYKAPKNAPGRTAFLFGDAVIAKVRASCTGPALLADAGASCALTFAKCSSNITNAAGPGDEPASCKDR